MSKYSVCVKCGEKYDFVKDMEKYDFYWDTGPCDSGICPLCSLRGLIINDPVTGMDESDLDELTKKLIKEKAERKGISVKEEIKQYNKKIGEWKQKSDYVKTKILRSGDKNLNYEWRRKNGKW